MWPQLEKNNHMYVTPYDELCQLMHSLTLPALHGNAFGERKSPFLY